MNQLQPDNAQHILNSLPKLMAQSIYAAGFQKSKAVQQFVTYCEKQYPGFKSSDEWRALGNQSFRLAMRDYSDQNPEMIKTLLNSTIGKLESVQDEVMNRLMQNFDDDKYWERFIQITNIAMKLPGMQQKQANLNFNMYSQQPQNFAYGAPPVVGTIVNATAGPAAS